MNAKKKRIGSPRTVEEGLKKLAMGSVNDVVKLVMQSPEEPVSIEGLDLFHIKEIHTNRDGMDIKFYDRLEALKYLEGLQHRIEEREEGRQLLQALTQEGEIKEDEPE